MCVWLTSSTKWLEARTMIPTIDMHVSTYSAPKVTTKGMLLVCLHLWSLTYGPWKVTTSKGKDRLPTIISQGASCYFSGAFLPGTMPREQTKSWKSWEKIQCQPAISRIRFLRYPIWSWGDSSDPTCSKRSFLGHDSPTLPIEKGTHVFSPSKQDGTDRTAQNLQNLEWN